MNPSEKDSLRASIQKEISSLESNLHSLKQAAQPVSPDNAIGRLSRQDALQSQQIHKTTLAKTQKRLSDLKQALERIETPDFGVCIECEEIIAHKRLLLMPETRVCVGCSQE